MPDAFERTRPGSSRDTEALVREHESLVYGLARRYANRGEPLDDLVQVGMVGLLEAIRRWDPARGPLASFAVPTILGEIRRYFRDASHTLRLPRAMQELLLELHRTTDLLAARLGRTPSIAELVAAVGRSEEEVLDALAADHNRRARSISEPVLEGAEGDLELGVEDDGFAGAEARAMLPAVLRGLPPRERVILHLRFSEGLTQSEIAARVGVSQMHVSRLLAGALEAARTEGGGRLEDPRASSRGDPRVVPGRGSA